MGCSQRLEATRDTFLGVRAGRPKVKKVREFFPRGAYPSGDPGLLRGGRRPGDQAVEAAPRANRHVVPPRCGPALPAWYSLFPISALPMEMTLMRRDLPGSFRFGMLASMAPAFGASSLGLCLFTTLARPSGSSSNGGTAALVTAPAPRLAIPCRHLQRALAVGRVGNWGREKRVSRCWGKGPRDVITRPQS